MHSIDKNSPIPAYYQVYNDLKKRISIHEWPAGHSLPSEAQLYAEYHVSRITIRQALKELERDGFIRRQQGKPAIVAEMQSPFVHSLNYNLVSSERFNSTGLQSYNITAQKIEQTIIDDPSPEICSPLQIPAGTPVFYFSRLYCSNGKPIALGKSWISAHFVPGIEQIEIPGNKLSAVLANNYRLIASEVDDTIEVTRPTLEETHLLDISPDSPLMLVKGLSVLNDQTPLEFSNTFWIGNAVRFKITLKNVNGNYRIDNKLDEQ